MAKANKKFNRVDGVISVPKNKVTINKEVFDTMLKQTENDMKVGIDTTNFEYVYSLVQNIRYNRSILLNSPTMRQIYDFLGILYKNSGDVKYHYFQQDIFQDYIDLKKMEVDYPERKIKEYIVNNFSKIFFNYKFIKEEYHINNENFIDILAENKLTKNKVIIEIKKSNNNPNPQLLRYGKHFNNPELIAISEEPVKTQLDNIQYYLVEYVIKRDLQS